MSKSATIYKYFIFIYSEQNDTSENENDHFDLDQMTTNFIGGILIFADFIEVFKHDDMVNYAQIVEYTSSWK